MKIKDRSRNIPSLDGLRALSILLVIGGHSGKELERWTGIAAGRYLFLARSGVSVFFVISGFLITGLLLQELNSTGTIRLKRFYMRRAFRIFPAFYFYLGVIFILVLAGILHNPLRAFFYAAIYTSNYYWGPGSGFTGLQHTWSLSVEEQFYLLWPAALLFLGRLRGAYLSVAIILLLPFSRLITYFVLAPPHRAMVDRMFHSSVDTIMFGCLLALLWGDKSIQERMRKWAESRAGSWVAALSVLFLLILDPMLAHRFRGTYSLLVGLTLGGLAISAVLLYVVERPATIPGRLLNTPLLRHIGIISYSLYLWQNIIISKGERYFPFDLVVVLACAEFSYWAIERPSLRLRDRLFKAPRSSRGV